MSIHVSKSLFFFVFLMCSLAGCTSHPQADLIVIGTLWTGDEATPYAEAMAIAEDTIVTIGTKADIMAWQAPKTQVITAAEENLIVPGFIDTHTHFIDAGFRLSTIELRDAKTPREFITRIADFAATQPKGTWILGGEWDHKNWDGEMPTHDWIDSVTQGHPVWVQRLDLHMGLANAEAMKLAGITDNVQNVSGGEVVRDVQGKPTGIFKDMAKSLVERGIPVPTAQQQDAALQAAMKHAVAQGVTTIHSMRGTDAGGYYPIFQRAHDNGTMLLRVYYSMRLSKWAELDSLIKAQGRGDDWLQRGILKEIMDGSLGSHTAAFLQPFTDSPKDSGFFLMPRQELYQNVKAADKAGLQITVHAIGDRAIHTLLDVFEQVEKENGPGDRRFRMEHAQHIAPQDIPRFASVGVIASMQPYHAIDDGRWAETVIGHERAKTTYAFHDLFETGAMVAFGSDWSVAPIAPLQGIYAAVTRRTLDGQNPDGWIPEQKITVAQALKAYTYNAAYAGFQENKKGTLQPGKLADFVILEKNIFEIDPTTIPDVRILKTIVGGKTVYQIDTL